LLYNGKSQYHSDQYDHGGFNGAIGFMVESVPYGLPMDFITKSSWRWPIVAMQIHAV